ncbi:EIF3G factor, partial [Vidua chalybeata]|nr:EIF3G factor [Vidua chalybeata]
ARGDTPGAHLCLSPGPLPSPKEVVNGNIKTITEYREEEDGRKVKIIRTFRIETRKASKAVARRKNWKKFGNSEFDAPGPNVATTTVSDDVFMTFITSKEVGTGVPRCVPDRGHLGHTWVALGTPGTHLGGFGDTWDTPGWLWGHLGEKPSHTWGRSEAARAQRGPLGAHLRPPRPHLPRAADDNATIRVTNLSEDTRETDLQELFRPFGSISRIYLAKDKTTGQSKGFAFISFHRREDAARAIAGVSGFGYDHLILNVEWAKCVPGTP